LKIFTNGVKIARMERRHNKDNGEITDEQLKERIEFFRQLVSSGVWSVDELHTIAEDASAVVTFFGIKPMFLPDSAIQTRAECIAPWEKLINYARENSNLPVSEYILKTLMIVPGVGVVNLPELRSRITLYADVFDLIPGEASGLSDDGIKDIILETRKSRSDLKLGTLIGFPPGSSLNYEHRSEGNYKLHKYFSKGKENAINDNWNEDEILDVDAGFTTDPGADKNRILNTLKKHQQQVGLTDEEVLAYAYADGLSAFGYSMFYFPEPRNRFSERDETVVAQILNNDQKMADIARMVEGLKEKRKPGIVVSITPISTAKSVWFPREDEDYL
jgi:hypothetical protein